MGLLGFFARNFFNFVGFLFEFFQFFWILKDCFKELSMN